MEYKVVVAENEWNFDAIKQLEEEVKALLEDGWQLQGGVSVSVVKVEYGYSTTLAQAMTK